MHSLLSMGAVICCSGPLSSVRRSSPSAPPGPRTRTSAACCSRCLTGPTWLSPDRPDRRGRMRRISLGTCKKKQNMCQNRFHRTNEQTSLRFPCQRLHKRRLNGVKRAVGCSFKQLTAIGKARDGRQEEIKCRRNRRRRGQSYQNCLSTPLPPLSSGSVGAHRSGIAK